MRMKLSTFHIVDRWFNKIAQRPSLVVTLSVLWLMLIGWIGYGWNLGNVGLVDETEPLFAEASRQMFVTGDWITPFFNGVTRFDKPALIYWCQALAYSIIGVNEWAVRIPSAIAAIAVISLAFYTVQWHLAKQDASEQIQRPTRRYITAAIAAAVMALNPEMIVWGRTGVSDMLLTGCIASALLCFFLGYASKEGSRESGVGSGGEVTPLPTPHSPLPNKWYLACYVLIAGAILTKGPVGIVLPGIVIVAFLLYLGKFREVMREMRPLLGLLIIFALAVPWYALVIWRNGWNYINSFFGYHNIDRFTEVVNGHSAPWYFYFLVVLLGFAPYSVYLPAAFARLKIWQRSQWQSQERSQQLSLFAGIWFLGVFVFFTIAVTKLPSYVLPLMPAAAILVALFWSDCFPTTSASSSPTPQKFFWFSGWANVVLFSALSVAMFQITQLLGNDQAAPNFRQTLENSGVTELGGYIWLLTAISVAFLIITRRWRGIIGVNLLGFVAFLIVVLMPAMFLMDQERQMPLREISAVLSQVKQPNEEIVMVGFKKPSVVFYSHQQINFIKLTSEAVVYIKNQINKPPKSHSLLVLAEHRNLVRIDLQPDDYENLASKGAYQLIRISFKKMQPQKQDISSLPEQKAPRLIQET
ncbi:glycosyltransferase family 39 protein [Nostoc spongiaeforme FACHB-130]|uniref:Glycosyltransferase family 39 protein n=1 Tax=Nostoc spongiaeforme FACHB-130 TaxID=1357510 RepID=A0ABR8FTJ8_9NOSO|nr:glycosyltransferase family 39 protein [Nostoc spongiaeforme]MBD2594754.1 glycosyltransferase family 39 protein [Nostoc spongiaeforme FACHB-130]